MRLIAIAVSAFALAAPAFALNPQPLPPREMIIMQTVSPGSLSSLNPQPLPPKTRVRLRVGR